MVNKRIILSLLGMASGLDSVCYSHNYNVNRSNERPNILLIALDDLGYSDIEPFGGEIRTPNMNKLSEQGVTYTKFHTSSLSAPTRSMLLTGVDNHLSGFGIMPSMHAVNQYMQPGYEGYLNDRVVTISEILQNSDYYTCMAGKWHLGMLSGSVPSDRGFKNSYVLIGGGASHFANAFSLGESEDIVTYYVDNGKRVDKLPEDFYSTEFYTDKMIDYIKDCPKESPFFGYLAFTAPHDPLHILDEWADKYKGVYNGGYDDIRSARLKRQKELGLISSDTPYNEGCTQNPKWEELSDDDKNEQVRRMEIYAAMIEYVDYSIGRVIDQLKESGKYDNTLIILFSDNGANPEESSVYSIVVDDASDESFESNYDNSLDNYGKSTSFMAIGSSWAEVCNTPYSLYKKQTTEGGICTPLIISGKGFNNGSIDTTNLLHVTDILPTILDYTDTKYPKENKNLAPLYGKSIIAGGIVRNENDALCFEMTESKAIIKGDWKAVLLIKPHGDGKTWKLYNLKNDIREKNDMSSKHPDILEALVAEWNEYAISVGYIESDGSYFGQEFGYDKFYEFNPEYMMDTKN